MSDDRRCIASHASDSDYAPTSRVLLWKLGYALVPPEDAPAPALRVVRDDRLGEVPGPTGAPIILLTRASAAKATDPRILGQVRRPAGLHELYRLIQAALEERPRSVPRVSTRLVAHARSETGRFDFTVTSLSENGCLVSGTERPPLETVVELEIELPWGQRIGGTAVVAYQQGECLGLVFHGITVGARKTLAKAVIRLLERL